MLLFNIIFIFLKKFSTTNQLYIISGQVSVEAAERELELVA